MRKNSIKHSRINGEIRKSLSKVIAEEVHDPRVGMMTSVTDVEVATDLKTCKVYISVLGSDEERASAMEGLRRAEGFLKRRLAQELNLRNTPELRFISDTSLEYGAKMSRMIEEVAGSMQDREEQENPDEEAF
ncbi:MAG: 30S ribosome-binding factor RbfA [Lachnospiraceae bacterium]|nr:30S ribosome-binding factor RbfA [Lachnospiraceae bacterium]